ncbi:hypothetical protein FRC02_003317 [Tulasnella sp. 418]|nr:hypothetical protein FRC02_003317 [Tulasnella sp. 418]
MVALMEKQEIINTFDAMRVQFDENNDRKERLIKLSREVTTISKKIIFLLHRVLTDNSSQEEENKKKRSDGVRKADPLFADIRKLFTAMGQEMQGDQFWRYVRSISPGLQEYMEALSFAYYLEHHALISYQKAQDTIKREDGTICFPLPLSDYVLGVSDLTGELMRFVITSIGRRGEEGIDPLAVAVFVRNCKADLEALVPHVRDLQKKVDVTVQSLLKIESAAYGIAVRGAEYAQFHHGSSGLDFGGGEDREAEDRWH